MSLTSGRRTVLKTVGGVGLAATFGSGTAVAQEINNEDTDTLGEEPTVYMGNKDGSVYAIDAVSGEQQWENDLNLGPNNVYAPTATDGRLYIGHNSSGRDPSYFAIDTESGTVEWEFDPDEDDRMTPPTIVEGTMYVGTDPSEGNVARLYALDAATGNVEWEYTDANRIRVAPTVVDNTVYIGARQGEVEWGITALDASTGEVEWRFTDAMGSIRAAPVVYKDKIFLTRNAVIALNRTTGEQEWEKEFDGAFDNTIPPVAIDGSLYIGADETLYSLNTSSGNIEWSHEVGESIASGTAGNNETVVVVSEDFDDRTGTLHAVDAQTGEELWTYSDLTEYDLEPQLPTIYDNTVYVTDTRLHAVDIETGEQEWIFDRELDFPRDLRSPTVVDNTEEGTSRDSRVRYGVLGHNDLWATRASLDGIITLDNIGSTAWEVTSVVRGGVTAPVDQENPDISLRPKNRYLIENDGWPDHPLELRDAAGQPLLSQATTGDFEDDAAVEWVDAGDELSFRLTEALAEEIDTYICTVHDGMQGTIEIEEAPDVTGDGNPAQDLTGDGLYEDVDGDGEADIFDVQALFDNRETEAVQNNAELFDFADDGDVDIFDVQALFDRV